MKAGQKDQERKGSPLPGVNDDHGKKRPVRIHQPRLGTEAQHHGDIVQNAILRRHDHGPEGKTHNHGRKDHGQEHTYTKNFLPLEASEKSHGQSKPNDDL